MVQQFAIVLKQVGKSAHGRVEPGGFKPIELVVFEINVVNDFGDLAESPIVTEAEAFDKCLEGAVFSLMGELRAEHVERDTAFDRLALSDEIEAGPAVDELSNEPG
jgi:hypothetical protein